MKAISVATLAALILCAPVSSMAQEATGRVHQLTEQARKQVVSWRRDIHRHPELSNREARTAGLVADALRSLRVDEIKTGLAHHGVVAVIRGAHPGPAVAVRADMDALPVQEATGLDFASRSAGVMHACGHDGHTAILLGVASVLVQMRDAIRGSVKLVFQPAEEGPPPGEKGGAPLMIEQGVLNGPAPEAIFALHVLPMLDAGKVGYTMGGALASVDRFAITVRGRQVHAAYPWDGVDPVVAASHIVTAIQTLVSRRVDTRQPAVVSVGVVRGGQRWNIIPSEVVLEGTVRTHDQTVRGQIEQEFERIVQGTAQAHGATVDIRYEHLSPVTWNDPELGRAMLPALEAAVGSDNVQEVPPVMGGEDFAHYAKRIPGFYIRLGVRNERIGAVHPVHTPHFVLDERSLPVGVRALTLMALRYLDGRADGSICLRRAGCREGG